MKGLRWWRRAKGLTQQELAEASGVERSHLAKIERGEIGEPRPDTLRRLAEVLGVEVVDLLYGELSVGIFGAPEGLVRGQEHHRNITASSPQKGRVAREIPTGDQRSWETEPMNVVGKRLAHVKAMRNEL